MQGRGEESRVCARECAQETEQVSQEVLAALPPELREEIQINIRLAALSSRPANAGSSKAQGVRGDAGIKRFLSQEGAGARDAREPKNEAKRARAHSGAILNFFHKKA
jgi:hypothetical protein